MRPARKALLSLVLALTLEAVVTPQSLVPIYKKASHSIFLVETEGGGGSGFCIAANGLIATSLHVIDGSRKVILRQSGTDVSSSDIDLVASDTKQDLAVLKLSRQSCDPLVLGNSDAAQPGQRIFVLGNPLGRRDLTASITDGLVSGIRHLGSSEEKVIQISAPLSPGNSGGPVLDDLGHVIGVVAFKLTDGELLNFAMPANHLKLLLKEVSSDHPLFSWKTRTAEIYSSDAYRPPDLATRIFVAAENASGTCSLKDASWVSRYFDPVTSRHWEQQHIEKSGFGSVTSGVSHNKMAQAVSFVSGKSINGKWLNLQGQISKTPLEPDDIIDHLVDNWYAFCPGTRSLWRDVAVNEDSIEGQVAYRVKVKEPFFGASITFWFDKQTYLIIGREYVNRGSNGVDVIRDLFYDFQKVDNFTVPFETRQHVNERTMIETISSFKANLGFPDYVFEPQ